MAPPSSSDIDPPAIAKAPDAEARIMAAARSVPSHHRVYRGNALDLSNHADASVQMILTSPPYWKLKDYEGDSNQLGAISDYKAFLQSLRAAFNECFRVLEAGCRMTVVVGDVSVSRKEFGRHKTFPLHADIQTICEDIGFDNLAPIFWNKISNARFESRRGGGMLGKPYEPGGILKNDTEFILNFRKPGAYRSIAIEERKRSVIPATLHAQWFQQIWRDVPGTTVKGHPAAYPVELAERLIRMHSFVGDTVMDPFCGSGSTNVAALQWGRNSVGVDIAAKYVALAQRRLADAAKKQGHSTTKARDFLLCEPLSPRSGQVVKKVVKNLRSLRQRGSSTA